MALPGPLHLRVPFTSANLGPGFDLFGLALNLYARFQIIYESPGVYRLFDENERPLVLGDEKNYIRKAYLATLADQFPEQEIPGITAHFQNDIPGGRGFGSSACAFVAGVAAANHYLQHRGRPVLDLDAELRLLSRLEGHPDNSTPARVGGWVFVYEDRERELRYVRKQLPEDLGLVALIPDYTVSTQKSRTALPEKVGREDILSGMRGSLLWLEYIQSGDPEFLMRALRSDRLHEPYRAENIPNFAQLRESLTCYGLTISGSGPGMLAFYSRAREDETREEIEEIFHKQHEPGQQKTTLRFCLPEYGGSQRES